MALVLGVSCQDGDDDDVRFFMVLDELRVHRLETAEKLAGSTSLA